MTIKLATGPVTWGVDFADTPTNPPWLQVLNEIAESGLRAMELGPVGYLPEDPDTVRELLAERNLLSAGSFVFDDLHDPDTADPARLAKEWATGRASGITIVEVSRLLSAAPDRARFVCLDGIHLTEPWHRLMAKEWLKLLVGARGPALEN